MSRSVYYSSTGSAVRSLRPERRPHRFVCLFCQHRSPFSTRHTPVLDNRSPSPFLERTRKRIWGTENPPGNKDVYYGESQLLRKEPQDQDRASRNDEMVTIGSEDDGSTGDHPYDGVQAARDVKEYERQMRQEEWALFQQNVDEAQSHQSYKPKQTWDGMEMVGGEKEFLSADALETPEEIIMAIHRAVVEVFAAVSTKQSIKRVIKLDYQNVIGPTKHVHIAPSADGLGATLRFPDDNTKEAVMESVNTRPKATEVKLPGEEEEEPTEAQVASIDSQGKGNEESEPSDTISEGTQTVPPYTLESLQADIHSLGRAWRQISLANPAIKLAIARRVMQLIGKRIPDPVLQRADTVGFLVSHMAQPPKAKTLYETLTGERSSLLSLPNVSVMGRRETPVDREKEVGRWKVIEGELRSRGLPVLGKS